MNTAIIGLPLISFTVLCTAEVAPKLAQDVQKASRLGTSPGVFESEAGDGHPEDAYIGGRNFIGTFG